jgi:hypothetical protein
MAAGLTLGVNIAREDQREATRERERGEYQVLEFRREQEAARERREGKARQEAEERQGEGT